jgi:CBS domain-containing protein
LPVLERNRLIGGVNARELAHELRSLPDTQLGEIGHLASPLTEDLVILEAAARMRESDSESMPIVDQGGALTGWVNFPDIFRYVISPERGVRGTGEFVGEKIHPGKNPVSSISDSVGVTATADMTAPQAVELLYRTRRNEATVIEDGLVLGQISILGILSVTRERSDVLIQVAGLEEEDPFVVNQITGNMRATALKLGRMCRNMSTPEIKVKSYEHGGSSRRRYEVRVTFSIPERYVAEAKGWDLLSTSQRALKRVEREIIRNRSKLIDSHRHRGSPPNEE